MSRLFPCLSCQQGEGTADTQSGATTGPGGVRAVPAASVAMEVPGRECHSPPGSAGIESPATAAADSQHTQKVQGEDQGETPCALGKLAEQVKHESIKQQTYSGEKTNSCLNGWKGGFTLGS